MGKKIMKGMDYSLCHSFKGGFAKAVSREDPPHGSLCHAWISLASKDWC